MILSLNSNIYKRFDSKKNKCSVEFYANFLMFIFHNTKAVLKNRTYAIFTSYTFFHILEIKITDEDSNQSRSV